MYSDAVRPLLLSMALDHSWLLLILSTQCSVEGVKWSPFHSSFHDGAARVQVLIVMTVRSCSMWHGVLVAAACDVVLLLTVLRQQRYSNNSPHADTFANQSPKVAPWLHEWGLSSSFARCFRAQLGDSKSNHLRRVNQLVNLIQYRVHQRWADETRLPG